MYKKIAQLNNVFAAFNFYKDSLICNIGNGTEAHLTFYDSDLKKTFQLEQTSYDFFIYKSSLFFTSQTIITDNGDKILKSYHLDIRSKEIKELPYTLHIKGIQKDDKYFCWGNKGFASNIKDSFYFLIDLNTFKIEKELSKNIGLKKAELLTSDHILFSNRIKGLIGNYYHEGKELWQKDLSNFLKYDSEGKEQQGQIKQVKEYKNSLIVVSDGGVIRLALETGEIIWKVKGYTRTMEIVGETGYCCTNHSLWKLNLETGRESGYGWEHHRLPDIEWNGRTYWAIGHEVIYHGGLLWYSVFASGHSFLLAINPHDGHYEWIHLVETNEKTDSPRFYDNKMFLLDTGGTLHIYEKDK